MKFGDKHVALAADGKFTDLWLKEIDTDGSSVKGVHLAFAAESREVVDTFYQAAMYVISWLVEELALNMLFSTLLYRKVGVKDNGSAGERDCVPG